MSKIDKPNLVGERITLRPIRAEDAPRFWASFHDEEVNRLTGTQHTFTKDEVIAYYARIVDAKDRADYAITLTDNPVTIIGEAVLNDIDWLNRSANFRIALLEKEYFNQGYGTEATRLLVQYGFETLNLHRIELEVYDFNPRAAHVYEKVGFVREGVRRDVLLWDGQYQSAIVMSLLKPEYEQFSKS